MMKEKDVVRADFSVLIIVCFERLCGGGGILRIHSEYGCETTWLPRFIDKELADVILN
jgi:hypothetical protein